MLMQSKYNPLRDYITPENIIRAIDGGRRAYNTYNTLRQLGGSSTSSSSSVARTMRRSYNRPNNVVSIRRYSRSSRPRRYPRRNFSRPRTGGATVQSGVSNPFARFGRGRNPSRYRGSYRKRKFCKAVKSCVLKDIAAKNIIVRDEPFTIIGEAKTYQNLEQYFSIAAGLSSNDLAQIGTFLNSSLTLPGIAATHTPNFKGYLVNGFINYEMVNQEPGAVEVTKYTCYPRTDIPLEYVAPGSVATAFPAILGANPQLLINGILTRPSIVSTSILNSGPVNAVSGLGSLGGGVQYGLTPYHSPDWCRFFKIKKSKSVTLTPGSCSKWSLKLRGPKLMFNAKFDGVANSVNAGTFIHQRKQGPIYLFRVRPCVGGLASSGVESALPTLMTGVLLNCIKHMQYNIAYVQDSEPSLTLDSTTFINTSATLAGQTWQQPLGGLQGQI